MVPAGMGTGLVESATGYSARLAAAHNVTLAVLFGYEIAPLLDKNHLRNSEARSNKNAVLSSSFRTLAPAVDGHGITADTYIDSLQKLTMRDDLRFLAMLPWKEVIAHRHLVRSKRAWCPACYYEWHHNGATIYEPLAWSLAVIAICVRHRWRLQSRCHRCKQELRPLASRSYPGYCAMCYAWLGEPAQSGFPPTELLATHDEFEWQRWVYEQTCNLLATAPTLTTSPRRLVLADSISRCIRASIFKTELTFARNCGLSQSSVNDLCRGASVPQLSTLLRIAFLAKVSVLDLVLGRIPQIVRDSIIASSASLEPKTAKIAAPPHRWNTKKVIEVRRSFEELLEILPPLPMMQIKARLNYPASTLASKFPDLHLKAVTRYKEYNENRRLDFWRQVSEKLKLQLGSATPLSVSEVAREIGRSRTSIVKQFPTLCMQLSAHWVKRREEYWGQIRTFLQDALREEPPLHLKAIAKQLKLSHTSLYTYFPQLCREIAIRYALHLRQVRVLKNESLRSEVRSIAITLYKQGIYPSVRKVSQHLSKPLYLRSSKVALASLREIRHECGLHLKL